MKRRQTLLLCLVVSGLAKPTCGQEANVLDRVITGRFTVTLPLEGQLLARTVMSMAKLVDVPAGIETRVELTPSFYTPSFGPQRVEQRLNLDDMNLRDALQLVFEHAPDYAWSVDRGVVVVRPERLGEGPGILEAHVPVFAVRQQGIKSLMEAVHRVFDSTYTIGGMGGSMAAPPGRAAERARQIKEGMERPVSVVMGDVTVRDVLNEIVRRYGNMMWQVSYVGDRAEYKTCAISLRSYDGWGMTAAARPKK